MLSAGGMTSAEFSMCATGWKGELLFSSVELIEVIVEVLSVKRTCLCKELLYTDNNFHLNLDFKFATQTIIVTFDSHCIVLQRPVLCSRRPNHTDGT